MTAIQIQTRWFRRKKVINHPWHPWSFWHPDNCVETVFIFIGCPSARQYWGHGNIQSTAILKPPANSAFSGLQNDLSWDRQNIALTSISPWPQYCRDLNIAVDWYPLIMSSDQTNLYACRERWWIAFRVQYHSKSVITIHEFLAGVHSHGSRPHKRAGNDGRSGGRAWENNCE